MDGNGGAEAIKDGLDKRDLFVAEGNGGRALEIGIQQRIRNFAGLDKVVSDHVIPAVIAGEELQQPCQFILRKFDQLCVDWHHGITPDFSMNSADLDVNAMECKHSTLPVQRLNQLFTFSKAFQPGRRLSPSAMEALRSSSMSGARAMICCTTWM